MITGPAFLQTAGAAAIVGTVGAVGAGAYASAGENMDEGATAALDFMTPSLQDAAMYGMAMHGPRKVGGLASGGLVGYSTFFTGYRRGEGSTFRAISLGRAAGLMVSATARAIRATGIQAEFLDRASEFHKYGLGAFISPDDITKKEDLISSVADKIETDSNYAKDVATKHGLGSNKFDGKSKSDIEDILEKEISETKLRQLNAGFASGGKDSFLYKVASLFGGRGYDTDDDSDIDGATKAVFDDVKIDKSGSNDKLDAVKLQGSMGKVFKGATAASLSVAARSLSAFEIGSMIVDAGTYAMGAGYKSMVESAVQLQRRIGVDNYMSGGYFNRAATSERQRVIQTMNRAKLAPRDQIFGNEAFYGHNY